MKMTALFILVLASGCTLDRWGVAHSEGTVGSFDTETNTIYVEGALPTWEDLDLFDNGETTYDPAALSNLVMAVEEIKRDQASVLEFIKDLSGPATLMALLGYGGWQATKKKA